MMRPSHHMPDGIPAGLAGELERSERVFLTTLSRLGLQRENLGTVAERMRGRLGAAHRRPGGAGQTQAAWRGGRHV